MSALPLTAAQAGLVSCETCALLSRPADPAEPGYCPRCSGELAWRRHHSIQYTWALVIAAAICFIPANVLPVLTTQSLGEETSDTILGGAIRLWAQGAWPLSVVIVIASFVVPLAKLFALTWLLMPGRRLFEGDAHRGTRLYRVVDFIGRWSMVDIYVGGLLVGLVQFYPFATVGVGPAAAAFGAVVVLTMLASRSFDPRLLWDTPVRASRTAPNEGA